jgi:site-specific DNA-methyltransferase (cytosine-N4-specific)
LSSVRDTESVAYRLQPFERRLAELEADGASRNDQLAFFARYGGARTHQFYFDRFVRLSWLGDGQSLLDLAESTTDGHRSAAHNYLTHGLHAYKGKYFPQVVRSLLNAAGVAAGARVVDPFVGSGTTSLEASLMGCTAHGIDQNPLAALIARTKVAALHLSAPELGPMEAAILAEMRRPYKGSLPNESYLARWFPPETLGLVGRILAAIERARVPEAMADLARLTLSSLLRSWSLQEPSQLRIHRRPSAPDAASLRERFVADLRETIASLRLGSRLLDELGISLGEVTVLEGDARQPDAWIGACDALVTSPPYATALPYIDTDRLSIYALGLAEIGERSGLEWSMIGNRELRKRQRTELEAQLDRNVAQLPPAVIEDILTIRERNQAAGVGFRRQNLPSLLYRYFADMQTVLERAAASLKPSALAAIVVGDSFTTAGRERFRIRTADAICETAGGLGYKIVERIEMGGQVAYLPHQRNTIPSEEILILRSPRGS